MLAAAIGDVVLRLPGAESLRDATDIGLGGCTATAGGTATGDACFATSAGAASRAGGGTLSAVLARSGASADGEGCGGGGDAGGGEAGCWTVVNTGTGEAGCGDAGGACGCCCT